MHDVHAVVLVCFGAPAARVVGEALDHRMLLRRDREQLRRVGFRARCQARELDDAVAVGGPPARVVLFPVTDKRTAELPDLRVVAADTASQHALIHFYQVLGRINERDRTAFVLRYIEGMEAAEVAAALDVSVPTARRCFTRAWERVTFFAQRDPFLVDYLSKLEATSPEETP